MLMCVIVAGGFYLAAAAGDEGLQLPKVVEAGSSFSIPTRAAGKAVLYLVSPAQVLRRNVSRERRSSLPPENCTMRDTMSFSWRARGQPTRRSSMWWLRVNPPR